jgi:hypothetical protein
MKRILVLSVIFVCICALLAAGCTTPAQQPPAQNPTAQPSVTQQPASPVSPKSQGDSLFAQGENAFRNSNYHAAEDYFALAKENYSAAGDKASFIKARDMVLRSMGPTVEFPYNRSAMEAEMAAAFPGVPAAELSRWLDADMTATLKSDGEVWYFEDTVNNVKYHNLSIMRAENARVKRTPLYDKLAPLIATPWKNGTGPYGDPVAYVGATEISIPRGELPANGTLKLWLPVPIETGSQTNVTIISVEPARYMKSSTGTGADLGLVYLEVPLEEITDPFLNVSARYRFVQHEQRFTIDPAKVKPYNTSSPDYRKFTAPSNNIVITPEMKAKASEIVGNETNPYLMAKKIYWDIITTHPYSHAPHLWMDMTGTPESSYVLKTGIGDCGSQSMYFAALCRSVGIPARAAGGYQMVEGTAGTHFWAEYYLEGYGWIPVDVTVSEGGEWSYNATPADLQRYHEYFFGSIDPYRYIIQKDVDIPLSPGAGDAVIPPSGWVQLPRSVCDTCPDNPLAIVSGHSKVTVTKE